MAIGQILKEVPFREMMEEFSSYRIDPFIYSLRSRKGPNKGEILPFVRGLRLSARLIYVIRDVLSHTNLEVNWGHVLIDNETRCSKECDIIIHNRGHIRKWNGNDDPIMNFKFVDVERVRAVISCKSYVKPYASASNLDKEFYDSISEYVEKVYAFAECCNESQKAKIVAKAKEIGYSDFWYLYTLDNEKNPQRQPTIWNKFITEIKKLK